MARGREIDRASAELVLQMKARNRKLTTEEIAKVMGCDATTVGRILRGGSWEGFCEIKKQKAAKVKERKDGRKQVEIFNNGEKIAEIEGQIEMDLQTAEEPKEEKYSDTVRLMRFQAAQADKILMKLETINDTLNMLIRAVRKE